MMAIPLRTGFAVIFSVAQALPQSPIQTKSLAFVTPVKAPVKCRMSACSRFDEAASYIKGQTVVATVCSNLARRGFGSSSISNSNIFASSGWVASSSSRSTGDQRHALSSSRTRLGSLRMVASTSTTPSSTQQQQPRDSTSSKGSRNAVEITQDNVASLFPLDSPAASRIAPHGITSKEWERLLRAGQVVYLRQGELLVCEGDLPPAADDREVFLLLTGECRGEVRGAEVARILPGDFVGEASFTSGSTGPRSGTMRVKTERGITAISWTTGELRAFLEEKNNANVKAALQACWMAGLGLKLTELMLALAGQPSTKDADKPDIQPGDYGYRYPEDVREAESVVPVNSFTLAYWNFAREYRALRRTFRFGEFKDTWIAGPFSVIDRFLETSIFPVLRPSRADLPRNPAVIELQRKLGELKLSNEAIAERENVRMAATKELLEQQRNQGLQDAGVILRSQTPWYVMVPYKILCWFLDVVFDDRPIQRFWFLETVARMPYFSYLSMLHFLETMGWWSGGAELRKVHFAEEYNEMMHLRIMESLGGDTRWSDRFFARHAALVYFWVLVLGYFVSPFLAYNFSELIESHAVDTYTEFAAANKELLQSLPPTPQALNYYQSGDMYLFDEFQTSRPAFSRRPVIKNLYDVFTVIRDDELEHVKTMFACERGTGSLVSPNAAATSPRWAEDAVPRAEVSRRDSSSDDNSDNDDMRAPPPPNKQITGGAFTDLRADVARKSPLEAFYAATLPFGTRDKTRRRQAGSRETAEASPTDVVRIAKAEGEVPGDEIADENH